MQNIKISQNNNDSTEWIPVKIHVYFSGSFEKSFFCSLETPFTLKK